MQNNSILCLSEPRVHSPSSPQMADCFMVVLMDDQTDYRSDYRSDYSKHSVIQSLSVPVQALATVY